MPELNFLKATPMEHFFCLGNLLKASSRKVSFPYSSSLQGKAHTCSSRSPWASQRQPCPCSIVIPNLFPGTCVVTQMFFWRPFPLCFLLFSVSSHWHPSVLNTSLEKDPLSWWQQSKFWVPIPCGALHFLQLSNSQDGWAGEGTPAWASACDVNHPLPLQITLPARSKVNRDWQDREKKNQTKKRVME